MGELTAKQQRFVEEYLVDLNATQAAIRAGYAKTTAEKKAPVWVGKSRESSPYPAVWDAVDDALRKRSEKTGITAEYVLKSLQHVAERCMQAEPVRDREGNETGEYRFDSSGANKSLELLGRHLKLFTDKVEHTGKDGGPIELTDTERAARIAAIVEQAKQRKVKEAKG